MLHGLADVAHQVFKSGNARLAVHFLDALFINREIGDFLFQGGGDGLNQRAILAHFDLIGGFLDRHADFLTSVDVIGDGLQCASDGLGDIAVA